MLPGKVRILLYRKITSLASKSPDDLPVCFFDFIYRPGIASRNQNLIMLIRKADRIQMIGIPNVAA